MARGLILSAPTFNKIPGMPPTVCKIPFMTRFRLPLCRTVSWPRFFCKCGSSAQDTADMTKYHEAFSSRMAMAGLKSHHRIALGVSGGPDSIALCVLTAQWKTNGRNVARDSDGFIDGLLAIVVDHGLRAESKEEANIVSRQVSKMGIKCEIAHCDWLDGRPKQGHLLEAARDMRYQILQKVCIENQIGVLLIAHHADDQAELFILRLSRNSGVLGLAGMPFTSQIFSSYTHFCSKTSKNYGILLVRPLLDFSKEDMYKICQRGEQDWVEDPTNQSPSHARNRIRMSLRDLSSSSCKFNSELQVLISACQKARLYVDRICSNLISKVVTINDLGYAVINLGILNQSKPDDICLSRFLALILQFISQRHRPIRGSTSKLLLEYMQTFPCKTSLTAAGCYLCPSPGSKGTKVLVCCSVNCPLPITIELFDAHSFIEKKEHIPDSMEQIVADSKSLLDPLVPDASDVYFLDMASESVLAEAKKLNMLSKSTYKNILMLKGGEAKHFKSIIKVTLESEMKDEVKSVGKYSRKLLYHGQICCFMNRFFISWKLRDEIIEKAMSKEASCDQGLGGESLCYCCRSCRVGNNMVAEVRHMIDSDWLYLANLSKCPNSEYQTIDMTNLCFHHARLSAQKALLSLKHIPAAARRGLPVLVNVEGILLSIPSIDFKHCPHLNASAVFKPRVPLGGGHSSFL